MIRALTPSFFRFIPKTVWAVGFVTLLMNVSTIIIFSLSPLYLTSVLGISMISLGILEGAVEASSWFTRIFAGVFSDYFHRRKPFLFAAYSLAASSRLIFPLVPSAGWIFFARFVDRVSNGIQATPREALIGDVAPIDLKGACYGLRQTLGMFGSFAGAFMLMFLMHWSNANFELAFWAAVIPPFFALLILAKFVRDPIALKIKNKPARKIFHLPHISDLTFNYWRVVIIASIFMLSNYSGAFMILQATNAGLSTCEVPLVMVIQNIMAFASAFPAGWLSDRIGRRILLGVGFSITVGANLLLACTTTKLCVLGGVALWGLQLGINQSLLVAKVADTAPEELRGTAFGLYYFSIGVALFISNYVAGWLSTKYGSEMIFYVSAGVAAFAVACVTFIPKRSQKELEPS